MIFPKLFNHGNLKSIKKENNKLIFEGTYGKEEFTDSGIPSGGSAGQVLTKTAEGEGWYFPINAQAGEAGQVLTVIDPTNPMAWFWRTPSYVPAEGTTGQVLTKTSDGYGWANASADKKIFSYYIGDTITLNAGSTDVNCTITKSDQTDLYKHITNTPVNVRITLYDDKCGSYSFASQLSNTTNYLTPIGISKVPGDNNNELYISISTFSIQSSSTGFSFQYRLNNASDSNVYSNRRILVIEILE